ncbi:MAG: anti-sigma factor [Armatimonadota bacterium]
MDCELAQSLIGDYLDEELSEELRDRVRRHLVQCRQCAWEAESIRETLSALRASSLPTEPTPEFRERLLMHLLKDHRAAVAGGPRLYGSAFKQRTPLVLELANKEGQDATTESD